MTNGKKGQMFLADLIFVAAIYIATLILGSLSAIPILGLLFSLVLFIFVIVVALFASIFTGLYQASFYVDAETAAPEAVIPETTL